MSDTITPSERSALMRRVRTRNTACEVRVRQALHATGFRFRLHRLDLPGTPDIVLPRFGMCIFVHGCFWHGHHGCPKSSLPKTRTDFWATKISRNRKRDRVVCAALRTAGWRVTVVWECRTKTNAQLAALIREIALELLS